MLADNTAKNAKKYDFMPEETNSLGGVKPIQPKRRILWIVLSIVGFLALFCAGFAVGYFVRRTVGKPCRPETKDEKQSNDFEEFHEMFKESISAEKLESVMR